MSAQILDGRALAKRIKEETFEFIKGHSLNPGLVIIQLGVDPASDVYVRQKVKACESLGIRCDVRHYSEYMDQCTLGEIVGELNKASDVDGIIIQLPLPDTVSTCKIRLAIDPKKDVDGLHPYNGPRGALPHFYPCTPLAIAEFINTVYQSRKLDGLNATVIGRSDLVGMPTAELLINRNATVTVCHSKTKDLAEHTRNADILVVAAGHPGLVTTDMVKPGAVVIDVGINRVDGKLCGDVDFEGVKEVAGWITPVPGGVGPMTVAMLMRNVVVAADRFKNGLY